MQLESNGDSKLLIKHISIVLLDGIENDQRHPEKTNYKAKDFDDQDDNYEG